MEHNPFSPYQSASETNTNEYTYVHGFGFTPPPPVPSQTQMIRSYSSGIGLAIIAYFALSYFMPMILSAFSALVAPTFDILGVIQLSSEVEQYFLQDISFVISIFVPFWFYVYVIRMPARAALPFRQASPALVFGSVPIVLACSVIGSAASILIESFLSTSGITSFMPSFAMPVSLPAQILYAIRLCLLAPVLEEMVFRGFIMQSLRRFGDSFALICSSLLFAMVHANMIQMPNAFITGLALGYFALHTGSLLPCMIAHIVNNTIAVAVTIATQSMGTQEQAFISQGVSVLYLMAGVTALLILLRTRPNMFTLTNGGDDEVETPVKYKAMFLSLPMVIAAIIVMVITVQYMVTV